MHFCTCRGRPGADVPQDAIQALDSALNASAANSVLCTSVSRACFFQGSGTFGISGGAEVTSLTPLTCP